MCRIGPTSLPQSTVRGQTLIAPIGSASADTWPRRDRSNSAPRSVVLRVEIGRTPRRDRSGSGSRSVVVQCGVVFGVGSCVSQAGQPWAGSERRLRMPGAVGVAHSRTLRVSRNRGIMRNNTVSSGHGPAPMCTDHPHRTWEPDRHTPRSPEKPVIPTKTSPHPTKAAVSHVQHRQQPRPPGATSTPPKPTHHKLELELDRSQRGLRPISRRRCTDLAAELDRSRHGAQPAPGRRSCRLTPDTATRWWRLDGRWRRRWLEAGSLSSGQTSSSAASWCGSDGEVWSS